MHSIVEQAIALRRNQQYEESRAALAALINDIQYGAIAHLHTAWSYDNQGLEQEALPHYKSALEGTLSPHDRLDALLGIASTLRSFGEYSEALRYFESALSEYPNAIEVQPFYAMCLHNLGRHKEATALLLKLLLATTNSEAIKGYQRAISLYADDLDC